MCGVVDALDEKYAPSVKYGCHGALDPCTMICEPHGVTQLGSLTGTGGSTYGALAPWTTRTDCVFAAVFFALSRTVT
jgi:hypothetical protein